MIKTLSKAQKMEREKFRIPRSVQDAIPIRRIFADGIFQVGNQYSKTWSFTDINYAIAGKEDKTAMFLDYSELLNALDSGASAKITIYNRRINKAEFEKSVLLPDKADGLDEYRHEFNKMLTAQVTGTSNSIVRERYLTVSVVKRNPDEARSYFSRVGTDLVTHLAQLSSVASELTLNERLHIFRDFFKAGEQAAAEFNIHEHAKRAQHFKDWLCPDSMEFAADHFKIDARFGRVLYLQDYASYIKDSFVSELCDLDRDLMLSIDILPVPTDEAARQLQSTLLGVETNVANWQRRQNANNNFTATIPYDMELQRNGVLFAAGSCWEGIDFPSDMVSLLIIAKLPFPIPDPVSDYERRQYPNLRDYINAEIIPEMQKKLRQGFGRAIRTEQDSCVVAILDERAGIGGKYHDAALAALPTCPTTEKIEDVQQFIREQKRPDYFL